MLNRLGLTFETQSPGIDEQRQPGETPLALANRLAMAKAAAVAGREKDAVVIGADQVVDLDGVALGKPGDHQGARAQLSRLSGRSAVFYTALAVVWPNGRQLSTIPCWAQFLQLTPGQIEAYLKAETPYDTAGSAKAEGLGIALLSRLRSDDPTAIIGLPLIRLAQMLRLAGIDPLGSKGHAA